MIPTDPASAAKKRDRRGTWFAIVGLVVLIGGLYVAGYFLLENRLPTGTRIAGVGVGGLTPDEAKERLEADLAPHTDQTLTFYFEQREYQVKPADLGLDLHIEESVESAGGGRTWNPVRMLEKLVGSDRLDPVVTFDEGKVDALLKKVADDVDVAPVEPRVTFAGSSMKERRPAAGRQLMRDEFEDLIREQFVQDHEAQPVPVAVDHPGVRGSEFDDAVRTRVKRAVGSPIRISVKKKTYTLSPGEVKSTLSYVSQGGRLVEKVDMDRFRDLVNEKTSDIRRDPTPATVVLRGGKPKVVADKPGRGVQTSGTKSKVVAALRADKAGDRVVPLAVTSTHAAFRTDDAKKLGIKRRVGTYETTYRSSGDVKPGRLASRIDGTVVKPGQTLSFNAHAGPAGRSQANRDGASQVATTLFGAGLRAGMRPIERHSHRTYQKRLPVGRDAAVGPSGRNLRLKNTSKYGLLVNAWGDPGGRRGSVHVELWSTKQWTVSISVGNRHKKQKPPVRKVRRKRCKGQSGQAGFDIDVGQRLVRDGKTVRKATISSSYDPVPRIRCRGKRR